MDLCWASMVKDSDLCFWLLHFCVKFVVCSSEKSPNLCLKQYLKCPLFLPEIQTIKDTFVSFIVFYLTFTLKINLKCFYYKIKINIEGKKQKRRLFIRKKGNCKFIYVAGFYIWNLV